MQTFLCTIHKVSFGVDLSNELRGDGDERYMRCPVCVYEELVSIEQKLEDTRKQRDLLLQAIDLKRLILPLTPGSSS